MIKTAIAVFICFCVDMLRGGNGIVVNAAVAAVLCMQTSVSDSKEAGWNRVIGTFIGGITGAVFISVESLFLPIDWLFAHYILVALGIIPVIYITVYFRRTATASLSCVIYLIITVARDADMNPIIYSANRILDTIIGIAVSLLVNAVGFYIMKRVKKTEEAKAAGDRTAEKTVDKATEQLAEHIKEETSEELTEQNQETEDKI